MKKLFFIIILLLTLAVSIHAQDIIVLKNGNMIEAKILEVLPSEIRYRRFDNLNGPIHVVLKNEVYSIRYENGTVDLISAPVIAGQKPPEQTSPEYNPDKLYTSLSFDPAGFLMGGPSAKMEFAKGTGISSFHVAFPTLAANSTAEGFGFGAGGSLNYIWNKGLGGFYLGALFEWNVFPYMATISNPYGRYNPVTDSYTKTDVIEKVTAHDFIFALNAGYRFVNKSGMYFRTGVALGFNLSTVIPSAFYFKPDIAAGYVWGAKNSGASSSGGGYNAAGSAGVASNGLPLKVDLLKLSTLKTDSDGNASTALRGNYQKLSGVKNETPLTKSMSDVLIFLPREALPADLSKYKRLTITCKYYDAAGREIPQGDAQVILTMVYYLNSDIRGPSNGPGTNTPVKEFNVGGPSGTINTDKGVSVNFKSQPPEAVIFQNVNPNIAFIEMTSMVFHNGDYKSQ